MNPVRVTGPGSFVFVYLNGDTNMMVLGLDPSLRSYGWAVYDGNAAPNKRRVASGHEGTIKSVVPVVRFIHFRSMVENLLKKYEVQAVGIESPAYGGGAFSEIHFGLMMFSLEAVFNSRKDLVLFDPTTLKYLIGNRSIDKVEIQKIVQIDTMDTNVINNDEADAYCIAKFASRFLELKSGVIKANDLTDSEKKVFLQRKKSKKTLSGARVAQRTAHIFRENSRHFCFSQIPKGNINLPDKSQINEELLSWLSSEESDATCK